MNSLKITKVLSLVLVTVFIITALCSCGLAKMDSFNNNAKRTEEIIEKSNELLEDGKLREAINTLYDGLEDLGDLEEINQAIEDYFKRVTFKTTTYFVDIDSEYCFKDTSHPYDDYSVEDELGLALYDTKNGVSEEIVKITVARQNEDAYILNDDDIHIVANKNDTCLFYSGFGAGKFSSFMYTVHSNDFKIIDNAVTKWNVVDDVLIGHPIAFAVDQNVSLYAYNWNAELLYEKEDVFPSVCVKDSYLYCAGVQELETHCVYTIYKIKVKEGSEEEICTIELSKNSFLWLEEDNVKWTDNGEEGSMKLSELKNIEYEEPKKENTADDKDEPIVITLEWDARETELDISVNLSIHSINTAEWKGNNLCYPNGTVIATKSKSYGKQTVSILKPDEKYEITIDDLNYGEHIINYVSNAKLTVKNNGKIIANQISDYMYRAPTGYWYTFFALENGTIQK